MVKFGRHVDFFVANELHSRSLYVVPYKEIQHKTCIDPNPDPPAPPSPTPLHSTSTTPRTSRPVSPPHHPQWHLEEEDSPQFIEHNHITLGATTGAELASAVRQMLIAHNRTNSEVPRHTDTEQQHDNTEISNTEDTDSSAIDAHFFANRFQTEWRIALKRASIDFERAMKLFWSEVFTAISDSKDEDAIRGALPDAALQIYVSTVKSREEAQELLSFLKDIHATALINAEALRKLVKKFDKLQMHKKGEHRLSGTLLPEVYSSNFTVALPSLEAGLTILRVLLGNEEEDGDEYNPNEEERIKRLIMMDGDLKEVTAAFMKGNYFQSHRNNKEQDEILVRKRKDELIWLRNMVESIDPVYIPFLVAHRGFHSIHDRSDVRPLENSLMAYEAAWASGIHLCECDIRLTKDERIILAHDDNFARLGMDPTSPLCKRAVEEMTYKELMNCPLKSGARPPLLFDVLRSAIAISDDAKMIVEIKAGNTGASTALAKMFTRHPALMEHVAVIMSFDVYIMHNLRREMAAVYEQLYGQQSEEKKSDGEANNDAHPLIGSRSNIALGSCLSTSPMLHPSGNLSSSPLLHPNLLGGGHNRGPSHSRLPTVLGGHNRLDSRDHFGLGMGISMLNLAGEGEMTTTSSSSFLPTVQSHQRHASRGSLNILMDQQQQQQFLPENELPVKDSNPKHFPKLLLITVAKTPSSEYELQVDITDQKKVARLDSWLRGGDGGTLDGVYMQFQKQMFDPEGSETMRNLASRYNVGIWGANPVPDDWETFHRLVTECHVSQVNTGLPKHFRRKVKRSQSATNLAATMSLFTE
ncbi:hypothetical protein ACHAXN_002368 [Cyclotella atomus]